MYYATQTLYCSFGVANSVSNTQKDCKMRLWLFLVFSIFPIQTRDLSPPSPRLLARGRGSLHTCCCTAFTLITWITEVELHCVYDLKTFEPFEGFFSLTVNYCLLANWHLWTWPSSCWPFEHETDWQLRLHCPDFFSYCSEFQFAVRGLYS